jgi:hypothetical protein
LATNIWRNPGYIPIVSIGDAAKKLRAIQRNWTLYSFAMEEAVPQIAGGSLKFCSLRVRILKLHKRF